VKSGVQRFAQRVLELSMNVSRGAPPLGGRRVWGGLWTAFTAESVDAFLSYSPLVKIEERILLWPALSAAQFCYTVFPRSGASTYQKTRRIRMSCRGREEASFRRGAHDV